MDRTESDIPIGPDDPDVRRSHTTRILGRVGRGEPGAADELMPVVYDELRALAGSYFRGRHAGHTLEPTALVHEAFLRLIDRTADYRGRAHFKAVAATAMRQVLIDHHRRRSAAKRGGDRRRISLSGVDPSSAESQVDVLALEESLKKLEALDERQARVVVLRFYGGLTIAEVADSLDVSPRTIEGEWRAARAWLARELR